MKKVFEALINFLVGLVTAILASNPFVFKVLNRLGVHNDEFKYTVISLLVTLFMTSLVLFTKHMTKFISPLKIKITSDKNEIEFVPNSQVYEPKELEIRYEITPGGKTTMKVLKGLNIDLLVFFNPNYIDMTLENDTRWDIANNKQENLEFTEKKNQLHYLVLKNFLFEGKINNTYKTSARIKIRPKRVQNQEISLNYSVQSKVNIISALICKVSIFDFKCKGVKNG